VISVRRLSKSYRLGDRERPLFRDLSFDVPEGDRLALMGRNGQGKSTLIKIIGGVVPPTSGEVVRAMSCSWPLGFSGAFQGGMTGLDNIRFLARIYQRDAAWLIERVDEFAVLGKALAMPVRHYSSGMRARLAFGLSLAIEFQCYLIDEVISVGDELFRLKCEAELFGKRATRAFVIASHDLAFLRRTCTRAIIIEGGRAKLFEDVDLAADIYEGILAAAREAELDDLRQKGGFRH
jgi:capsular polysaccharide transport system ATP-binding protein